MELGDSLEFTIEHEYDSPPAIDLQPLLYRCPDLWALVIEGSRHMYGVSGDTRVSIPDFRAWLDKYVRNHHHAPGADVGDSVLLLQRVMEQVDDNGGESLDVVALEDVDYTIYMYTDDDREVWFRVHHVDDEDVWWQQVFGSGDVLTEANGGPSERDGDQTEDQRARWALRRQLYNMLTESETEFHGTYRYQMN